MPPSLICWSDASVAIDGSKFKAVNARDRNFTAAKMARRLAQIEESVARYLHQLDERRYRQEPSLARLAPRRSVCIDKIAKLQEEMARLGKLESASGWQRSDQDWISLSDPDARSRWPPAAAVRAWWVIMCRAR